MKEQEIIMYNRYMFRQNQTKQCKNTKTEEDGKMIWFCQFHETLIKLFAGDLKVGMGFSKTSNLVHNAA